MLIESIEHAGLTVEYHHDEHGEHANPRDNDGILGYIVSGGAGRDYGIGEEQRTSGFDLDAECVCEGEDEDCKRCEGTGYYERSLAEYLRQEYGARVAIPLFLLDHSGLALSWGQDIFTVSDEQAATRSSGRFVGDEQGWDTSFIGFAFDTAETRKKCGCENWDADRIRESVEAELGEYGKYIAGEVYGYVIKDEDGNTLDSCWGFIGWEYVQEEAKRAAKECAEDVERERREAEYWRTREVMTVG